MTTHVWGTLPLDGGRGWRNPATNGEIPHNEMGTVLHQPDLNAMATGALSLANMRTIMGDAALTDTTVFRDRLSLTSTAKGNAYTWTTTANDISQVVFQPKLSVPCLDMSFEYWFMFEPGFPLGDNIGGKMPGPGAVDIPVTRTPPSGGTIDDKGAAARNMFNGDNVGGNLTTDSELTSYLYRWDMSGIGYHGETAKGGPMAIGVDGSGNSLGTWHHVKKRVSMNTVTTEGGSSPPADGKHQIWYDGVLRYDVPIAWRKWDAVRWTHIQWSSFFGGDVTWAPTTGPWKFYLAQPKTVKYG